MIDGASVLAIVGARGGSKGVPRKNIRNIMGKPLVSYTIEAALASSYIDSVIVSSDDAEILDISSHYGALTLCRPVEFSTDNSTSVDLVSHTLSIYDDFDYVILLQPTSPLRTTSDIDSALELCIERSANSCVSMCEVKKTPFSMFTLQPDGLMNRFVPGVHFSRRQDHPDFYVFNGAIYIANVQWFKKLHKLFDDSTIGYLMPECRSLDIDSELDLLFLEFYLSKGGS